MKKVFFLWNSLTKQENAKTLQMFSKNALPTKIGHI